MFLLPSLLADSFSPGPGGGGGGGGGDNGGGLEWGGTKWGERHKKWALFLFCG